MVVRSDEDLNLPETVEGEDAVVTIDEGASFSGHERNHLFVNQRGRFVETSSVSGLDSPADGRAFGILDFDRDGWPDLAVVNANTPLLQLFRNEVGGLVGDDDGHFVALRFVGGNRTATPTDTWSPHDGYGSKVRLQVGSRLLFREYSSGGGMAAQNSSTLLIGIGTDDAAQSIEVTWPSGRVSKLGHVEAGNLVTVYEDADQSPTGQIAEVTPYRALPTDPAQGFDEPSRAPLAESPQPQKELLGMRQPTGARIDLYTTMATWCMSCRFEIPQLELLRSEFPPTELAMFGIPVDPEDDAAKLQEYLGTHKPPYELLTSLAPVDHDTFLAIIDREFGEELLPSTVLADSEGTVLQVFAGSPSVSDLRKALRELPPEAPR